MTEWLKGNALEKRGANGDLGGTMRLGAYTAELRRGSKVAEIYGATEISERHRHRYEVNTAYKDRLEQHGMRFCGMSPDGVLPEIIEYADHPWSSDVVRTGPSLSLGGADACSITPSSSRGRSRRTRCLRASSARRWSGAGWCS